MSHKNSRRKSYTTRDHEMNERTRTTDPGNGSRIELFGGGLKPQFPEPTNEKPLNQNPNRLERR